MGKPEDFGVKTLPFKGILRLFRTIDGIAQKRMSDGCHMHPDLMGPSRLQAAFDVGKTFFQAFQHPVMSDCSPAGLPVYGIFFRSFLLLAIGASTVPDSSFML